MLTPQEIADIKLWHKVYGDNRDPFDLDRGILAFSRRFFPTQIDPRYGLSTIHLEILEKFMDLFNPKYKINEERYLQLEVFRGGSKSTIGNLVCGCYIICMNGKEIQLPDGSVTRIEEDVVVLASETSAFATNWILTIRSELASNADLKAIFGNMRPQKLFDDENKIWRQDMFRANRHQLEYPYTGRSITLIGRGVGQQIRGLNLGGFRPTTIIGDDLYSFKSVLTPESREKTARWWDAECLNTLHPTNGKVMLIGTLVHEDTIIAYNEKSRWWKNVKFPIMDEQMFADVLKHCKINRDLKTCQIPDHAGCKALEAKGFVTYWKERFPLITILTKFAVAIEKPSLHNNESVFWQEMFHITLAEADKAIRADQMIVCDFDVVVKDKTNFIKIKQPDSEKFKYINCNIVFSIDSATSKALGAAHTALVGVAMDYYSNIYFLYANSGRWGVRDEYNEVDNTLIRPGTVDILFRVIKDMIFRLGVETYNVGNEIIRQVKQVMKTKQIRFIIFEFTQTQNKEERIISTLSPYHQTKSAYYRPNQLELMRQLEFLGKTQLRDLADATESAVRHLRPPSTLIEYNAEPAKEYALKQHSFLGMNQTSKPLRDWETS